MLNKGKITFVQIAGQIDRSTIPELEAMRAELLVARPVCVLFNAQGIEMIKPESYRAFALICKDLRLAKTAFQFVFKGSHLRKILVNDGLLDRRDISDSLEEAVKALGAAATASSA